MRPVTLYIQVLAAVHASAAGVLRGDLRVSTTSGHIQGTIDEAKPNVRQFFDIPYAHALGDLRFAAPKAIYQPDAQIDATKLGSNCMQYVSDAPSIYNQDVPNYGSQARNMSEDCLNLSVYASSNSHEKGEPLPVIIYIHGGGWQGGGQPDPVNWMKRSPEHIVITLHYRLTIFGFPGGVQGLESWNLGCLDQRLAVEWVRDNIAAFGGDTSLVILWGQSARAGSVDACTHAYANDPVVHGMIQSANPPDIAIRGDRSGANFSSIANAMGCSGADQIACMREVPAEDIVDAVSETWNDLGPTLLFYRTVDDEVVFANNIDRILEGKVANIPTIFGTNKNEGIGNTPYAERTNQILAHETNLAAFFCPITDITKARQEAGLTTYRYLYSGSFTNISPKFWMGAYHGAELPVIFGNHENYPIKSTQLEHETSSAIQDAFVAFARDPVRGLKSPAWEACETLGEETVKEFGYGVAARDISLSETEGECARP